MRYTFGSSRAKLIAGILLFNLLVFQPILEELIPVFSYTDECFAVGCLAYIAFMIAEGRRFGRQQWFFFLGICLVALVGLAGNVLSGLPSEGRSIIVDMIACTKFVIVFLALDIAPPSAGRLVRVLDVEARVLLILALICLAMNQAIDLGMTYEVRYGIKSFQFIYVHPSHLVTMALACLMIVASRKKRAWKLFVVFAVVLIASSLRSRWVALAFIIAVFFLVGEQRLKKSVGLVVAAAALCAMVLGASQMEVYYGSSSPSARNHLAQAALDIFWRGFPFGTGFGTYGTGVTKSDYSELYMQYGFDEVPGLSPNFSSYLTDTFWPAIMAQFGFFGLLVWLLLLGFIGCKIYRYGVAHDRMILALAFLATLLIASTASGAIFSTQMITLLFVYYLVVGTSKIEMDE